MAQTRYQKYKKFYDLKEDQDLEETIHRLDAELAKFGDAYHAACTIRKIRIAKGTWMQSVEQSK